MTSTAIDWHILLPALLAGLLVLATHVPLGAQVLQRGIVFIDLAIAQIGAIVVDVATGRVVWSHDAEAALNLAARVLDAIGQFTQRHSAGDVSAAAFGHDRL